jgi:hypothetical protein
VEPLERVRRLCMSLPEVTERPSHGSPTWFVRDKQTFVSFMDDHHGDGRLALWCAAPPGMQQALVAGEPDHYFVPPYVGHRGWIGVRLDRGLDWNEVAGAIEDAYTAVAPQRLVERAAGGGRVGEPT